MKKFSFFLMGALAMAFAACEDAPEVPPMQANPQEPVLEGTDVTVEPAGALADASVAVTLEDAKAQPAIEVIRENTLQNIPAGAEVKYVFLLSKNETLDPAEKLDVTLNGGVGTVDAYDWSAAHVNIFGKSPKEKTAHYAIAAYAKLNGVDYRIGGPDYYVAQGTVKETCMDQGFTISSAYYLIGNMNDWKLSADALAPYKFNHSDADVYDDPVFTIVAEVPADCYWKIVPEEALPNADWALLYGPATDGDEALEGQLVGGDNSAQSGKLVEAGKYRFTINMEESTYKIEPIQYVEYFTTPGGSNNWNQGASNWIGYVESKGANVGAAVLDGEFKLCDGESWDDPKTYGLGDAEGKLAHPGGNINAGDLGLYWVVANAIDMTYSITPVTSLGAIGDFNTWGSQVNFTPSADFRTWTGTITVPDDKDKTGWKIRINDNWDMNYGGTFDKLVPDGGNFSGLTGTLNVTVDFSGNYPKITVTQ